MINGLVTLYIVYSIFTAFKCCGFVTGTRYKTFWSHSDYTMKQSHFHELAMAIFLADSVLPANVHYLKVSTFADQL